MPKRKGSLALPLEKEEVIRDYWPACQNIATSVMIKPITFSSLRDISARLKVEQ
jgi:hypothetical protein